jgi:hypothetical protein
VQRRALNLPSLNFSEADTVLLGKTSDVVGEACIKVEVFGTGVSFIDDVISTVGSVARLGVARTELWRIDGTGLC